MMTEQKILIASGNKGKLAEFQEIAKEQNFITLLSPKNIGRSCGAEPEVEEVGLTYEENAKLKADAYFNWATIPSLADDTGLEVKVLDGQPGVFSARFAGEPSDPKKNIEKLLGLLKGAENREAKFVCVLALRLSDNELIFERAELKGVITDSIRGSGGFGYDSVFMPEGESQTLAELKEKGYKNTHRMLAVRKLFKRLSKEIQRTCSE